MGTLAHSSPVGQVLRLLPAFVLRALDAWSHRVALRRRQERRDRCQRRQAAPTAGPAVEYKLKPWRD